MTYELLIQHQGTIMLPPVVENVSIEWERQGQPGKLIAEVVKTPGLSFQEGDPCRFSVDGTPVFYGFVFEKSRKGSTDDIIQITVYDQLYYLKNKDTYDKVKDDGKPHFPKSQTFHLCAELQDCAVRILKGCEAANGRYFETEYEERLKDLDGVLIECQTMEQLINLSYGRKYITGDQCHYWAELVRPVRQKAFNWRKSDGNRAAALREAKAAQELAKMGQMALQIAEALRPQ